VSLATDILIGRNDFSGVKAEVDFAFPLEFPAIDGMLQP